MKFKILGCGTSTGVPVPGCTCNICTGGKPKNYRTRTSGLITTDKGENILIDATTDLRQQALTQKVARVDAVLYTHGHSDHILGTDDLRCFNFVKRSPIPCYATRETFNKVRETFSYIFTPDPQWEGGMLAQLRVNEVGEYDSFEVCGVKVHSFLLMHGKMSVTGFRIGELSYATDCKSIPEESKKRMKGSKYLILDALRYEQHSTHFTIDEAVAAAREIGAEQTYFVHMTHTVDYDEVNAKLPNGIKLAYDGLELSFK